MPETPAPTPRLGPIALRDGVVRRRRCERCGGPLIVEGRTDLVCLHCGDRWFGTSRS